jgi:Zn-dependent M16 (insulinase) family peptidase
MLEQNLETAVGLVEDLLLKADFRDFDRLRTIILEMHNDLKASLVPGGSHYAALRASARISPAARIEERWRGISQYIWLNKLIRFLGEDRGSYDDLASALEALRSSLIRPSLLTLNLTCEQKAANGAIAVAGDLIDSLNSKGRVLADSAGFSELVPIDPLPSANAETLVGSMNVNFVAHEFPGSPFGSRENAHEAALAHFLTTGFLWERIRMQGGAYGASASASGLESLFGFSSYRDPNTLASREAFREALVFASRIDLDSDTFEKIVLGAAGKEERPMAPGEKGFVAFKRDLLGIGDDQRQARRDALIDCTPDQLRTAAVNLLTRFDSGATVVLTHPEAVERDKQSLEAIKAVSLKIPD